MQTGCVALSRCLQEFQWQQLTSRVHCSVGCGVKNVLSSMEKESCDTGSINLLACLQVETRLPGTLPSSGIWWNCLRGSLHSFHREQLQWHSSRSASLVACKPGVLYEACRNPCRQGAWAGMHPWFPHCSEESGSWCLSHSGRHRRSGRKKFLYS